MIRLPVRELYLLRERVVTLIQSERIHADYHDAGWIARRIELRLKLQAINDQIDQERQDQWKRLDVELDQRHEAQRLQHEAEWEQQSEARRRRKEDSQIRAQLKQAEKEWHQREPGQRKTPQPRMWLHPTEPAEVIPPVPITEAQPPRDLAPHLSYTEIEQRASQLVSHHYATMGRKRSRRYEGFR